MKNTIWTVVLMAVAILVACSSNPPTPDDDLSTGILLGDLNAVQQALDKGANVNKPYKNGMTPLMTACKEYQHYQGEAGADVAVQIQVDLKNKETHTDLQGDAHASHSSRAVKGNQAIVELLLASGADVQAKDQEGQTALSLATRNNLPAIAEVLRKAGAKE
ncbi:MAG: ankyrin repeat domain-containing protein [Desulfobacterales bacterium]|nr:ankyrin repeat domain-containing protein [Desulfobacterales bacterium]